MDNRSHQEQATDLLKATRDVLGAFDDLRLVAAGMIQNKRASLAKSPFPLSNSELASMGKAQEMDDALKMLDALAKEFRNALEKLVL